MSVIHSIVDFFFPSSIKGSESVLSKKADAARQCYTEERERTKTIEGKASMFITSTGFLGTVLIGTSNILISQANEIVRFKIVMILCLLFFSIYMVFTMLYSIKALQRSSFCRPDPSTVMSISEDNNLVQNTIADLLYSISFNLKVTNQKMDYVVMAQRFFKRLICSVLAFVIVLLIYLLELNGISFIGWFLTVTEVVSTWNLNVWFVLVSSILLATSTVMSVIALVKIVRIKKG